MSASLDAAPAETLSALPMVEPEEAPARASWLARAREPLLALVFPALVLLFWHVSTAGRPFSLIPPPLDAM